MSEPVNDSQQVALVTGGSRGIGRGIAEALLRDGLRVAINGVRPEADVADVMTQLRDVSPDVLYGPGDVSDADDRAAMIDAVVRQWGRLDVLINNAGITSPGRKDLLDAEEAGFDRVVGVNLKGPYFLTQLAARQIISQHDETQQDGGDDRRGVIVNISSVSAEMVSVNRGDYCLTKSAMRMMTMLWATRLAEHGIDVYEVQPGVIRSDMTSGVEEKYDRLIAEGLTLERRWGTPEDVGRAVAALVRGDVPYATGQRLKIDGGMTIRSL